jgi:hypothetical protein
MIIPEHVTTSGRGSSCGDIPARKPQAQTNGLDQAQSELDMVDLML